LTLQNCPQRKRRQSLPTRRPPRITLLQARLVPVTFAPGQVQFQIPPPRVCGSLRNSCASPKTCLRPAPVCLPGGNACIGGVRGRPLGVCTPWVPKRRVRLLETSPNWLPMPKRVGRGVFGDQHRERICHIRRRLGLRNDLPRLRSHFADLGCGGRARAFLPRGLPLVDAHSLDADQGWRCLKVHATIGPTRCAAASVSDVSMKHR